MKTIINHDSYFQIIYTIIQNKRPVGLITPPFKTSFLNTENWPKFKLDKVETGSNIAKKSFI